MSKLESDTSGETASQSAGDPDGDSAEVETVLTTAADVESAGRSCLAIVVLAAMIIALLLLWIVVRSTT